MNSGTEETAAVCFLQVGHVGLSGGIWTFGKVWEVLANTVFSKTKDKIVPFWGYIILTYIYTWLHPRTKQTRYVWGPIFTCKFGVLANANARRSWHEYTGTSLQVAKRDLGLHHSIRILHTGKAPGVKSVSYMLHIGNIFKLKLRQYKLWRSQGRNIIFEHVYCKMKGYFISIK